MLHYLYGIRKRCRSSTESGFKQLCGGEFYAHVKWRCWRGAKRQTKRPRILAAKNKTLAAIIFFLAAIIFFFAAKKNHVLNNTFRIGAAARIPYVNNYMNARSSSNGEEFVLEGLILLCI